MKRIKLFLVILLTVILTTAAQIGVQMAMRPHGQIVYEISCGGAEILRDKATGLEYLWYKGGLCLLDPRAE